MNALQNTKSELYQDPICEMTMTRKDAAATVAYQGKVFYFCSKRCEEEFSKNPEKWASQSLEKKVKIVESQTMPREASQETVKSWKTYYPLILIFSYLIGGILFFQLIHSQMNFHEMMNQFMGGFFIIFSFFKFLNLQGFKDAYSTYDLVAQKFPIYGYVYPFIELTLGLAYLGEFAPWTTNLVTLVVMSVSALGVLQALRKKQRFQCACLGTVFNLPMTTITLIEDVLMVVMAAMNLVLLASHRVQ